MSRVVVAEDRKSPKIIPKSKRSEWTGLDEIGRVVHAMNCIWREQEKDDIGIDGEIELCLPREDGGDGWVGTGKIVKVQSKSGNSYITANKSHSFASPVSEKDVLYWRGLNVPVIYVVYHPRDKLLYWKDIKSYFADDERALEPPLKVTFDKSVDRFDEDALAALLDLCEHAPERVDLARPETLYTNVLEVTTLPEFVYVTPVLPERQSRFHRRLTGRIPPYVFKGSTVVTLTDPEDADNALTNVIEGPAEAYRLDDYMSQAPENENDVRALLNAALHRHLRRLGLDYQDRPRKYFFNKGLTKKKALSRRWTSAVTQRTQPRLVTKYYEYGKLGFFRHIALDARFERFGEQWAILLFPRLHYTRDGKQAWDGQVARSYAIRARAQEYNPQYLNHLLFWSQQLSTGNDEFELMVEDVSVATISGVPASVTATFSPVTQPVRQPKPKKAA